MKVTKIGFLNDDNVVIGTIEREVIDLLCSNFPEKQVPKPKNITNTGRIEGNRRRFFDESFDSKS